MKTNTRELPKIDREPSSTDIRKTTTDWGTIGVLDDYPPGLDGELAKIAPSLSAMVEEDPKGGHRDKTFLELELPNGKVYKVIVKANMSRELRKQTLNQTLVYSVLNEIIANRLAAYRYKQQYGKELPIEKPVGFLVEKSDSPGAKKYVIFEKVTSDQFKDNHVKDLLKEGELEARLLNLGIRMDDYQKMWIWDPKKREKYDRWFIVDSELWEIKK